MRKITMEVCGAFEARTKLTKGNSHTDGRSLYLHGNEIAKHTESGLMITNAGWKSTTTKERLNGLCGVSIQQKKGVWYLNGKEWGGEWVLVSEHSSNPFKAGDKVRFKDDPLQYDYIVHTIYGGDCVSLGLLDYPDTEQDSVVSVSDIVLS